MSPVDAEPTSGTVAGASGPFTIERSGPALALSTAAGVVGAADTSTGSSTDPPCEERTMTVAGGAAGAAIAKSPVPVPSPGPASGAVSVDVASETGTAPSVTTLSVAAAVWSLDFAAMCRLAPS